MSGRDQVNEIDHIGFRKVKIFESIFFCSQWISCNTIVSSSWRPTSGNILPVLAADRIKNSKGKTGIRIDPAKQIFGIPVHLVDDVIIRDVGIDPVLAID